MKGFVYDYFKRTLDETSLPRWSRRLWRRGHGLSKNAFADPTSADVQAQADEARQKLNSMREQLGAASANYNQAVQEHDEAVSKMDECQTKIDDNNAQIDKLQDKLSKRARNMYRDGQTTFLDVILGSNSFDDFAKNWDTLTSLNEKRFRDGRAD